MLLEGAIGGQCPLFRHQVGQEKDGLLRYTRMSRWYIYRTNIVTITTEAFVGRPIHIWHGHRVVVVIARCD